MDEYKELKHLDKIIHEPARLMIMVILSSVEEADFLYLLKATELTRGNLSSHLSRLEQEGYIVIEKEFVGKTPRTVCHLTEEGDTALKNYRKQLSGII
ncbi:MAG: winged helix-turn-helix domain-containing protein [Candidatus Promineifilaceae bacterium]|jgi:DNA-binding MarR family transcriptional regulator